MDEEFVLDDAHPSFKVERVARNGDWIDRYDQEIVEIYQVLKILNNLEPTEAFQKLSSYSARVSEMRSELNKNDTRKATTFRQKQVDPLLDIMDRLFKIHSRIQATREMEVRLVGGQF